MKCSRCKKDFAEENIYKTYSEWGKLCIDCLEKTLSWNGDKGKMVFFFSVSILPILIGILLMMSEEIVPRGVYYLPAIGVVLCIYGGVTYGRQFFGNREKVIKVRQKEMGQKGV